MALQPMTSSIVSFALSLMLFSSMQFFKVQLASSEIFTILGGFMGSVLFVLLLTGFNNLENALLDDYFQAKIFPEIILTLGCALMSSAMVHRVCVTVCFCFSLMHLYFVNRVSAGMYNAPVDTPVIKQKSKKRKH